MPVGVLVDRLFFFSGDEFETARVGRSASEKVEKAPKGVKQVPSLLLAKKWEVSQDPKNWWISEKLDGVRVSFF